MKLITSPSEMQSTCFQVRSSGAEIGLVPTMGALHDGHMSLIRRAKSENDVVAVSIFINPIQFDRKEDLDSYPTDLETDLKLAESAGVDLVFIPSAKDMYPQGHSTFVSVEGRLTQSLCGAKRPGHFQGVSTVVCKLFNLINPHRAYFGQKDAQQLRVIQQMVEDLNFEVKVIPVPTVREVDGLAISSRNRNFSSAERQAALVVSKGLNLASELIKSGERKASNLTEKIVAFISKEPLAKVDYVSIVNADSLEDIEEISGEVLIALAVFIGKVRLIDNLKIEC